MLRLTLRAGPPEVIVARRDAGVPDGFWGELRSFWGYAGDPGRAIEVPPATFRGNLAWLGPACRQHRVGIDWAPEVAAIVQQAQQERRQLQEQLTSSAPLNAQQVRDRLTESRFVRDLRPFQVRDVGKLLGLPNGANFSVPGAGKTSVAYAVYEAERHAGRVDQMLVVAPLSAFDAWLTEVDDCFAAGRGPEVRQFLDFAPPDAEVLLVNYHRLSSNLAVLEEWVRRRPSLVLLDEAHRMKAGRNGTHGSACLDVALSAARRDVLSGTPAPQSPADFVALIDYLWPGQAMKVLPREVLSAVPPPDTMAKVAAAIRPLFVRTRKQELGLEPPQLSVVPVPLEGIHYDIYQALRDQYRGELTMNERADFVRMGTIVMYLLEAATNPHLLAAGSAETDIFRHPPLPVAHGTRLWELIGRYNEYETPSKFKILAQLVEQNAQLGRKTLVWSNFVRNLQVLERMFRRYEPAVIHGGVPSALADPDHPRNRERELARFRADDNCMVLFANPAAMSEGVSLHQVCHDAIYLDRTFNAGQYLQSLDRIHRLGLPTGTETRIQLFTTSGTIDEVVNSRISDKATALGHALDDPDLVTMALPDDENYGPALESDVDLAALFAHLRGD